MRATLKLNCCCIVRNPSTDDRPALRHRTFLPTTDRDQVSCLIDIMKGANLRPFVLLWCYTRNTTKQKAAIVAAVD
jgi:hypothetical protein